MAEYNTTINVQRNLDFARNFQTTAVKKTNVRSRETFHALKAEKYTITPQDIGRYGRRISIEDKKGKTLQDKIVDLLT